MGVGGEGLPDPKGATDKSCFFADVCVSVRRCCRRSPYWENYAGEIKTGTASGWL